MPVREAKEGEGQRPRAVDEAMTNCESFLRAELMAAQPERILALGAVPFSKSLRHLRVTAPRASQSFAAGFVGSNR